MSARKVSAAGNVYYSSPSPHRRSKPWVKVGFQVTPDEKSQLEHDAAALGLSVSAFLRQLWRDHRP